MAKTELKDLGSSVCVNDENEHTVPALGDGTAVPGDLCYIDPSDGKAKGSDVECGSTEIFGFVCASGQGRGFEIFV